MKRLSLAEFATVFRRVSYAAVAVAVPLILLATNVPPIARLLSPKFIQFSSQLFCGRTEFVKRAILAPDSPDTASRAIDAHCLNPTEDVCASVLGSYRQASTQNVGFLLLALACCPPSENTLREVASDLLDAHERSSVIGHHSDRDRIVLATGPSVFLQMASQVVRPRAMTPGTILSVRRALSIISSRGDLTGVRASQLLASAYAIPN